MGRPTEEKKDKTIKLRLSEELYERLEKESEGNMSGYVRRILSGDSKAKVEADKRLKEENEALKTQIKELSERVVSVPQNDNATQTIMSEATYRDLSNMCQLSGLTFERFMDRVRELFNDGSIYVDGITIKTKGDYDLSYLVEMCHRVNVDPQEMIDKLANSLVRR